MKPSGVATQPDVPQGSGRMRWWLEPACVVLLYGLTTYVFLYPLFVAPASTLFDPSVRGGLSLFSLGDMYTVMWVMSWGAHALVTAPLSLFDANIFYPARHALTSTEHMLGHLPVFGPVYLSTGNAVLANQVNLFVALTACGASMYGLLRGWGCARLAAIGGGLVFAYFPLRLQFVTHVHLVAGAYLVLALIAFDRALMTGRMRWVGAFAAALGLQCLCSFYLAYMSVIALAGYAVVAAVRVDRPGAKRFLQLAAASLLAMIPFLALAVPYLEVRSRGGLPLQQEHDLLRHLSVYPWRLFAVRDEGYYAGAVVTLLAAIALLPGAKTRRVPWARGGALAIALICFAISLGPAGEGSPVAAPYDIASLLIPGFSAMRAPSRFVLVIMLGLAALAGLGLDRLARVRVAGRYGGAVLAVLAMVAVGWDYDWAGRSFAVRPAEVGERVPLVYRALDQRTLSERAAGPVLELPAGGRGDPVEQERESLYTYRSIHGWWSLLNGRAGYEPLTYGPLMALARALPDSRALELLQRSTGLRYVVLHFNEVSAERRRLWRDPPGLVRVGRFGDEILFEVERIVQPDLLPALLDFGADRSVLGAALQPIPQDDRLARVELRSVPAQVTTGLIAPLAISLRNSGQRTWPVFTPLAEYRVRLGCRWRKRSGAIAAEEVDGAWLPYDVGAGGTLTVHFGCRAAVPPGEYDLEVGVTQGDAWFGGVSSHTLQVLAWRAPRNAGRVRHGDVAQIGRAK